MLSSPDRVGVPCQIVSARLKILAMPPGRAVVPHVHAAGANGGIAMGMGGGNQADLAPCILRGGWARDPAQKHLLPRLRSTTVCVRLLNGTALLATPHALDSAGNCNSCGVHGVCSLCCMSTAHTFMMQGERARVGGGGGHSGAGGIQRAGGAAAAGAADCGAPAHAPCCCAATRRAGLARRGAPLRRQQRALPPGAVAAAGALAEGRTRSCGRWRMATGKRAAETWACCRRETPSGSLRSACFQSSSVARS